MAGHTIELPAGATCRRTAAALLEALQTRGYAHVAHPAVPPPLLRRVLAATRRLGGMPAAEWRRCHTPCGVRGAYQYRGAGGRGDPIRCFAVGALGTDGAATRGPFYASRGLWTPGADGGDGGGAFVEVPDSACGVAADGAAFGLRSDVSLAAALRRRNVWPERLVAGDGEEPHEAAAAEFRAAAEGYYTGVAAGLLPAAFRHLAVALGADEAALAACHQRADHHLELKLYPPPPPPPPPAAPTATTGKAKRLQRTAPSHAGATQAHQHTAVQSEPPPPPPPPGTDRLHVHEDLSTVTLLAQDVDAGLQVLDRRDGAFHAAPVRTDAVMLQAGAFLQRWTNGAVPATLHRVVRAPGAGAARASVVCFAFPDFDAELRPLAGVGHQPPGAPFVAGDLHPLP